MVGRTGRGAGEEVGGSSCSGWGQRGGGTGAAMGRGGRVGRVEQGAMVRASGAGVGGGEVGRVVRICRGGGTRGELGGGGPAVGTVGAGVGRGTGGEIQDRAGVWGLGWVGRGGVIEGGQRGSRARMGIGRKPHVGTSCSRPDRPHRCTAVTTPTSRRPRSSRWPQVMRQVVFASGQITFCLPLRSARGTNG